MFELKDIETIGNGLIERFNVSCLSPAIGTYKHVTSKRTGPKENPFSYELEISGQLSVNEKGEFQVGDCKEQALVIINNISNTIIACGEHYGINFTREEALNHITNTLVLLLDMKDFPLVNDAYRESGIPQACRAAFSVKELPLASKRALIEIRVNALIPVKK